MPQAQMQTVTIDGQEAIYIPASVQHAPTAAATQQIQIAGNQAIFTPAGQIIRAQNIIQNVQGVGQVRRTSREPTGCWLRAVIVLDNVSIFSYCSVIALLFPDVFYSSSCNDVLCF